MKEPAMGAVFKLNSPEWYFILIGCLAAIINGGVQPAFGIILSKSISVSCPNRITTHKSHPINTRKFPSCFLCVMLTSKSKELTFTVRFLQLLVLLHSWATSSRAVCSAYRVNALRNACAQEPSSKCFHRKLAGSMPKRIASVFSQPN